MLFRKKEPYIDRKGNLVIYNRIFKKGTWENIIINNTEIDDEDMTKIYNDGFEEGYICGMQEMTHRMIESFLNSPEAKKSKINKFSAELTNIKKKSKDIEKFENYTNFSWI